MFDRVRRDVITAKTLGAALMTDSDLVADLLNTDIEHPGTESSIANLVLELALPSVDSASEADLMRVRQEHGESFEQFRIGLARGLREIGRETDPSKRSNLLDQLRHELEDMRVREMRLAVRRLRKGLLADVLVGGISLAASLHTTGATLFGAFGAAADAWRRVSDYQLTKQANPGHFLWKLRRAEFTDVPR